MSTQFASRGPRLGLMGRIALALAVVGLVPVGFAVYRLLDLNDRALADQMLLTHTVAARTAAERVEAVLASLAAQAEAVASYPLLFSDPRSAAAQQQLAGVLVARPEVVALVVTTAAGEEVIRVQRRELGEEISSVLEAAGEAPLTAVEGVSGRWLRLIRPLAAAGGGRLTLVADEEPLFSSLDSNEIGAEAELVLATRDGRVLAGSIASLDAFPEAQIQQAASGQVGGAGEFTDPGGEQVLGAFAPVAESGWYVASVQPARVAKAIARRMRRAGWGAVALSVLMVAILAGVAYTSMVRPIRLLLDSQQRVMGVVTSSGGSEIDRLRESFAVIERRMRDREDLGRVFLGRYQVIEVLGEGAMGTVFRGWDPKLERPVALKTVRLAQETLDDKRRKLAGHLLREATTAARFSHPNIVTIFDIEDTPEVAYIAMEYVDGVGLDELMRHQGVLSEGQTILVALAVARALVAAHDHGVVHRDIKPSNVLLGYDASIQVADFGIADFISSLDAGETFFGTPGYVAPEMLLGELYDHRVDLFALGVVLYECLTGRHPLAGKNLRETALRTVRTRPKSPQRLRAGLSTEIADLVENLLAKAPDARPQSAEQVVEYLQELVAERKLKWNAADLPTGDREADTDRLARPQMLVPTQIQEQVQ